MTEIFFPAIVLTRPAQGARMLYTAMARSVVFDPAQLRMVLEGIAAARLPATQ